VTSTDGPLDPASPPLLPDTTSDERDVGWGEPAEADDDLTRLRAERPPHYDR
jgi:hypothetical protein